MRKFNHTSIIETVITLVYVSGFLAMFTFTISAIINN